MDPVEELKKAFADLGARINTLEENLKKSLSDNSTAKESIDKMLKEYSESKIKHEGLFAEIQNKLAAPKAEPEKKAGLISPFGLFFD